MSMENLFQVQDCEDCPCDGSLTMITKPLVQWLLDKQSCYLILQQKNYSKLPEKKLTLRITIIQKVALIHNCLTANIRQLHHS